MKPNPISALNHLTVPSVILRTSVFCLSLWGWCDVTIVEFGEDRKFDEYGLVLICR